MSFDEVIQGLSDEFDEVTRERHARGAEHYGPVKFLEVDTVQMALEELADFANYARYLYIKLRLLEMGGERPTTGTLGITGWKATNG
jgi:hypothetical protein